MRKLVYKVCYTGYQVLFYLWWVGPVLKYCKCPKYYEKVCQRNFFLRSKIPMITQISGKKNAHLTLRVCSMKKFIINIGETMFKSNFLSKSKMKNSAVAKPLNLEV